MRTAQAEADKDLLEPVLQACLQQKPLARALVWSRLALSVPMPHLLCACPVQQLNASDLKALLRKQIEHSDRYKKIQVSLNQSSHICLLMRLDPTQESLEGQFYAAVDLALDFLDGKIRR